MKYTKYKVEIKQVSPDNLLKTQEDNPDYDVILNDVKYGSLFWRKDKLDYVFKPGDSLALTVKALKIIIEAIRTRR